MVSETKNILLIHTGLWLAEVVCWGAFAVELSRALNGNTLSWAYVFEWPLFALYALYMWRRLLRDERTSGSTNSTNHPVDPGETARLDAYNAYLESVHRDDPPPTGRIDR